jgi:hypothetical protein
MQNFNKKMKKVHILLLLFILGPYLTKAQVKDISFTLSPTAEYTWWDNKAGFEDNFLVGGKLGFGFGEYVELRAIYMQSLDLKTNFSSYGLSGFDESLFDSQNIDLTRWGGEFKANFGTKGIRPYLTLGAGVQNIGIENSSDFEQVYGALGLGFKFNITKRVVLALEGKNTTYRFNSGANLLTENDKSDFGTTDADFDNERLSNWSVQGSLQLYLGGRKPGTLSDLDKAYLQNFKGGFGGLQWVIEPSLAYVDFADESLFRDTYWLGGYAGLDLNEFIGIRAFYFQATQNEEISTDFDKMAMYGGEFRARLNDGNGVTPFLILGGGYLNPSTNYIPVANTDGTFSSVEGGEFATGGLGLNIPLGKHLLISGGARAMISSGENVTDITNTDDIQTHIFYTAGLKLTLGKKSKAPKTVYQEILDRELTAQQQQNNQKISQLKKDYQSKINNLENDLKVAYEAKDVDKAVEILEEKKQLKEALDEVESIEKVQVKEVNKDAVVAKKEGISESIKTKTKESSKLIKMTPAEFESLIDRILNDLDDTSKTNDIQSNDNSKVLNQRIEQLKDRVILLEKLLLELNAKHNSGSNPEQLNEGMQDSGAKTNDLNTIVLERLDELNKKIDDNSNQIQSDRNRTQTAVITTNQSKNEDVVISTVDDNESINNNASLDKAEILENQSVNDTVSNSKLKYKNTSAILGFNYGGASTGNIGFRLHYEIAKTKLEFMPEAYIGFGEANAWAVSGNVIYPFQMESEKFSPYAGAGIGFGNFVDGTKGFYNIIIGTKLPVLHKNLYVDYTMRNSFDYNQLAVGYNFKF